MSTLILVTTEVENTRVNYINYKNIVFSKMFSLFFTVCTKYLLYSCMWSKIYKKDSLIASTTENLDEVGCWHLLNSAARIQKPCSHLPFSIKSLSRYCHYPTCMEINTDEAWFQLLWIGGRLGGLLQSQTPVLGLGWWFTYLFWSYRD